MNTVDERLTELAEGIYCRECRLINAAHVVCRVYETVERPSIRPSHHLNATRNCCRFAAVGPAARRYRSIAARLALSSLTLLAVIGS